MISLAQLREDPERFRRGALLKGEPAPIDEILQLDLRARELRTAVEEARAGQGRLGKSFRGAPSEEQRAAMTRVKERIQSGEEELRELERRLGELLLVVPNPPHPTVPEGRDEGDNVVLRTWGEKAELGFTPRPHYDLGESLGIFDFERATKLSGARFAVLRGAGARLQRALTQWMLDSATDRGYTEIAPPYLVRREVMVGTGNLPKFEDEAYHVDDGLFLIPTAEVPVTNLYREEILDGALLPIRHVAATPCWRREAGSAGRDTRGYIRLHQFDKVELVAFCDEDSSMAELDRLLGCAEAVLQELGLHYRVLLMCSGDIGFAQWKKFDLEAWCPGLGRYLEVSSCSVFGDFQARRASIRYRPATGGRPRFVHTLNGSGLAVPRTFDAILETYQEADGGIRIPEPLRPYMRGLARIEPPAAGA